MTASFRRASFDDATALLWAAINVAFKLGFRRVKSEARQGMLGEPSC